MKKLVFVGSLALFCFILCCIPLSAQSTNGTITGRITDPSKATIPDAKVLLINANTNATQATHTDSAGSYHLTNIPPGNYRLEVEKQGFRTIIKPAIIVHVQDGLEINFEMALGATSETITVEGGAPLVDTESASVGTLIDRNFVDKMPLNGRSFQTLIQLTPGVVTTPASFASPGQFSVNGQRTESNYFMIDGVSANIASTSGSGALDYGAGAFPGLSANGGTNSLVSVDALQEFRIQTSTFAPEFGRTPGAQVSIVTRSGGNQFHGSAYEYFRNDVLDAADWFTNHLGQKKPAVRQNDFGGTLSGPILKNKLFFFFSYEGLRLRLPKTLSSDVPSGDSRQLAVAAMQPFLNSFPIPNGADLGNGLARFTGSYSDPSNLDASSLRLDYDMSSKWKLFARHNYSPSSSLTRATESTSLNDVWNYSTATQTSTVGATYTINSHMVNEFRYNFSRVHSKDSARLDDFGGAVPYDPALVFPSGYSPENAAMIFAIYVGDIPIHILGNVTNSRQSQQNFVDDFTLVHGSHAFKMGIDWRRLTPVVSPPSYLQQAIFSLFTGDIADTLGGTADYFAKQSALANHTFVYDNISLYGQDTWKLTPRTTLTYGLRWDYNPTPFATNGTPTPYTLAGITDYQKLDATGPLTFAPVGTPIYHASRKNFAPRIGLAQRLKESNKWGSTLRGGFGMFYDLGNTPAGSINGFPYTSQTAAVFVPFPADPVTAAPPLLGDTTPPIGSITIVDKNLQTPYTLQWNAAYEQQVGTSQALTFSYIGSSGRNLLRTAYYDGINPDFSSIQVFSNGGDSNFNSLQVQFQRNLSGGLQVLTSYSWSHSIDTESATEGSQPPSRASSDFDIRHTFTAAVSYEVPKPTFNSVGKAILEDWSVHTLIIARSAPPVDLAASFPTVPFSFVARPDHVPGQPLYIHDADAPGGRRFNPDAFAFPPDNEQGDFPRNVMRGFGATQVDFSVQRNFRLKDALGLRFRADVFNIFNHPNFGPPDRRLYSDKFGLATQTLAQSLGSGGADAGFNPLYQIGGPRSIQLSLRLEF